MKQKIIEGLNKKLLLVELPEDMLQVGYSMFDNKGNCYLEYYTKNKRCIKTDIILNIDSKNYKLTDITESRYQQWVDKFNNGAYRNYKDEYPFYPDFDTDNFYLTAKESFFSYLEKEGILFSNPLADYDGRGIVGFRKQFEEAESKVWQLSQTYLFQILN